MATYVQPLAKKRATGLPAWNALASHYKEVSKLHLRQFFADDPKRGERMAVEAAGLYLDYSKNRVNDETLRLLLQLAEEVRSARAHRRNVQRGEDQHHGKARGPARGTARSEGCNRFLSTERMLCPKSMRCSTSMADFSNRVRSGEWKGHTGKRIRNVINIGIGGSDLGPVMAYEALKHYSDRSDDLSLCLQCRWH